MSDYNLDNARLADLPWELNRTLIGNNSCDYYDIWVEANHPEWGFIEHGLGEALFEKKDWEDYKVNSNQIAPENRSPQYISLPDYTSIDHESCRLHEGGFYGGHLYCTNGVVKAMSPGEAGFSLSPIQIADFDHDGYMDILCGFYYASGGSAKLYGKRILSRKEPGGMFYVVE